MRLMPDAKRGRVLALILLVIVLILIYLGGVHWWFVSPLLQSRQEITDLRDEEIRLREIAQQRDSIRELLLQARQFEAENPGFLTESNFDLAASALIQRLQEQIDQIGAGERCTLVSRTPFRANVPAGRNGAQNENPFQKVTIKVRMRCEMDHFAQLLHGLEGGSPQLFVSDLVITGRRPMPPRIPPQALPNRPPPPVQVGHLDIAFDLYGYLRRESAPAAGSARNAAGGMP